MRDQPDVLRALDGADPRWDAYVKKHTEGTFFHLTGWKRVIERAYPSSDAHYLFVDRNGQLAGVLPLFASGGRPFTRALVSVPVGVSGGILADDDAAAVMLRDGARAVAEREKLPFVEYKSERRCFDDLATKDNLYFVFRQELYSHREKQLKAIPRKTRALLREGDRARLRLSLTRSEIEPFHDLYALSLRNLGTPIFPKELFVASLEELGPNECDILYARQCGRIIGSVMNYYYKDVMLPYYAGTLPEARDVGINNYLYWHMLETGYDRGYRIFDFGRSKKGTGAFKFKKHFGMKETPFEYQYDLVGCEELPNVNPTNPKYQKAIETWKRLPIGLTKIVGPMVAKRLP